MEAESDKRRRAATTRRSMSFGRWMDEQKAAADSDAASGSGGISSLFGGGAGRNGEDVESQSLMDSGLQSLSSMRSSLESQLPQKVMGMNYQQRFQAFSVLLLLSALFFALGFFVGVPMLTIRPQKFALSFTCGSVTFMGSFAILKGPYEHAASMVTRERLPFTTVYVGSMLLTLYLTFTVGGAQGYLLVLAASTMQLFALMWYLITFLPGGATGMRILTQTLWTMLKPVMMGCARCQAMCIQRCVSWYAGGFASSPS